MLHSSMGHGPCLRKDGGTMLTNRRTTRTTKERPTTGFPFHATHSQRVRLRNTLVHAAITYSPKRKEKNNDNGNNNSNKTNVRSCRVRRNWRSGFVHRQSLSFSGALTMRLTMMTAIFIQLCLCLSFSLSAYVRVCVSIASVLLQLTTSVTFVLLHTPWY